jgi:hypothetical protein
LREGIQRTLRHYLAAHSADYAELAYRKKPLAGSSHLRT